MNEPLIPLGQRPLPGDDLTCFTLAALKHTAARARMRELGIGPEAFEYSEERAIAAALMAEREFTPEEQVLLNHDNGRHLPWRLAIGWRLDPAGAVLWIDRFAAARARWWLPLWLEWILEGMAQGRPLTWVGRELEQVLERVRSVAAAEGRT